MENDSSVSSLLEIERKRELENIVFKRKKFQELQGQALFRGV